VSVFDIQFGSRSEVRPYSFVLKRVAAAERLRTDLNARLRAEGEFLREIDGACGVLRCYEVLDAPATLVLERVEGGSLAERLTGVALPPSEVSRVFRDVSAATARAHAHGIIHRDIKPSNILFTSRGELRLADFGIAVRRGARSTAEGWDDIDVGTLGYAPPELLRDPSTANTETVDIYELGALLHELLLGATPHMMHGSETEAELRARIVSGAPRDLTPRESELSSAHRHALDAALAPNLHDRPQSVAELLSRLGAL
jgi:serine/threonine protein kinase